MDKTILAHIDNWTFDRACSEYKRHPAPDHEPEPLIATFLENEVRPKILHAGALMGNVRARRTVASFIADITTWPRVQCVALMHEAWMVQRKAMVYVPDDFAPSEQPDRCEVMCVSYYWDKKQGAMAQHKILRSTGHAVLERGELMDFDKRGGVIGGNLVPVDSTATRH